MYGTVARFHAKPGRAGDLAALMDEWDRDFKPLVRGAMAGYVYRLDKDPDEMIMTAVFQDKETYLANAASPAQDKWFQRFRELIDGDPEWNDGEILGSV
ncbi:MAG: hypothetical protein WDA27_12460 [Actinomycetota bacterium]